MSPHLTPKARLDALLALVNSAAQEAIAVYEKTGDVPSPETAHALDNSRGSLGLRNARSYVQYEPACLNVVIRSNIAGILAWHPEGSPIADIAKQAGIQSDKLGRILSFLATKHCFKEVSQGVFANNRLSSQLIPGTPVADVCLLVAGSSMKGADSLYAWLTDSAYGLSEGPAPSPFIYAIKEEGRTDLFDWLKHNPEWNTVFASGMIGMGEVSGDADMLVQTYPFADLGDNATFCDIGGGLGHMCMEVVKVHPNIHATLQDQPAVVEQSKQHCESEFPLAIQCNRMSFEPIDFFKEAPIKDQDIYYLRHVVHDWSDSDAVVILKNIRTAMKPESRVLIRQYHSIVKAPEPLLANYGAGNIFPYYQDMNMMNYMNSKERSLDEFKALGAAAGLEFVKEWDFAVNGMVEFRIA
ncbi:hypothetical protein HWV62_31261 [Athelia sp. TMB]|nr:hypothetical protein HWV62_31261 [Athelia sp. TMB]